MREFFHGWKRKVGCITLVMACLFAALWIRGLVRPLRIVIPAGNYIEYVLYTDSRALHCSKERQIWLGIRAKPNETLAEFSIPHWMIVSPLTLLSACLLLSKPKPVNELPT